MGVFLETYTSTEMKRQGERKKKRGGERKEYGLNTGKYSIFVNLKKKL